MKVQDLMVKDVRFCGPKTNLAAATEMMWTDGCGALPVVSDDGHVIGIITDRDVCIALGTRDTLAAATDVRDVSLPKLFSCAPDDEIHLALATMAAQQVRRLPVIDAKGTLKGIISVDDVIVHAVKNSNESSTITYEDAVTTLQAICEPSHGPASLMLA